MINADSIKFINYDHNKDNEYSLNALIEKIDASGAEADVTKWLGPHNYTGKKHSGVISMDADKVCELAGILDRYDLEGWSKLPAVSSVSGMNRSLMIHLNDGTKYYIAWNAKFPKVFPPPEDVMYFELFNFFNGLIREAGWDDVAGEDIKDPRLNPAYAPRTVKWFGHEVKLKIGTGTYYEDGTNAEIDYEGKDWWVEEGFVGRYTGDNGADMTVAGDGGIRLFMDGEEWHGYVGKKRIYKRHAEISISCGDRSRWCELHTLSGENFDKIQIMCLPGPVPCEQFTPISVVLYRCKESSCQIGVQEKQTADRYCRNCGQERKPADIYCRNCGERL